MTATLTERPPAGHAARRAATTTPATMRILMAALVLLSLAWGAFGGWAASQHSSAASALISVDEPLSLDARQMYEKVADADVTITTAYLASSQPTLQPLQRYQADITMAAADLARLRAGSDDASLNAALAALTGGLPAYTAYVADAQSQYSLGFPLTGGSFMQVASEEAHLVLLPAAKKVFTTENAALAAASSQATGLPTMAAALVLALIIGFILYRAQRWLTRRTNRVLSPGLVLTSLLLVVSVVWLAASYASARSDLDRGIAAGSGPAESLAQASIGVQQIRGDAVLNVISRSGNASFQDDFARTSRLVGPGSGSLLSSAATGNGQAASLVAAAEREADAWYAANAEVYQLGTVANYAGERDKVISGTAAGYTALEDDITTAIADDQATFQSAATSGANALDPLEPVVIVVSLLMVLGCVWGLNRRLAEYR